MSLAQQREEGRLEFAAFTAAAVDAIPQVEQITREIFGPHFSSAVVEDCEIAGDKHVEFRVTDNGDLKDVLARNDAWHRRIAAMTVNLSGMFRLVIESDD